MSLVAVSLPDPTTMRGRWAAFAAVLAARGWGRGCHADGARWHFDDGGGNWADMHLLDGDPAGRAVLVGHDHEYSDTYYRNSAEYFQEEETDLLAGAPGWWAPPAQAVIARGEWVGFVYGFDGTRWQRAPYEVDDGFRSLGLVAVTDERAAESITAHTKDAPGRGAPPSPDDLAALLAAGADVTEGLLRPVIGPEWDAAAGVAAAAAFRP